MDWRCQTEYVCTKWNLVNFEELCNGYDLFISKVIKLGDSVDVIYNIKP